MHSLRQTGFLLVKCLGSSDVLPAWGLLTCGLGAVIWGIIDAVLILTGQVRDPHGLPLRDGA